MASLERALVIDNSEKRVSVIAEGSVLAVFRHTLDRRAIVISVASVRHERRHVELFGKRNERRDLFVLYTGVLESLEMKTRHNRQLLHRQLLRALLIGLTFAALYLGTRAEMFGSRESLETVEQRSRRSVTVGSRCTGRGSEVERNVPKRVDRR